MNYLRFRKLYQADNDGTFWPGYIELPDDDSVSETEDNNLNKNFSLLSNPRVYTGIGLFTLVTLFFLNSSETSLVSITKILFTLHVKHQSAVISIKTVLPSFTN